MGRENTYRRIPQIPGQVDKTTLNELYRQFSEMIYAGEGRRGPIEKKDSLNITASDRHSPLRFSGTGNRGSGAISFGGVNNASMFIAKGAYMNDQGSWVAEDGTAVIQEMNRDSLTPIMYRNEGLQIGQIFTPTSVGGVVVGTTPPGGGGGGPVPAISLNELSDVIITGVVDNQVLVYDAGIGQWVNITLVIDHGDLTGLLDNDHPLYQRKHGFEVASDGSALQTITYDKTTRKVTFTPTGASYRFWIDGVEFVKTGPQVSPAHPATTGKHFFYYDSTGTLQTSTVAWGIRDRTVTPAALVYWDNLQSDGLCYFECHTADRTLEQHYHDHFSQGTKYISGGSLSGYTLALDTIAGVTFAIASTVVADEDIIRTLTAVADGGPYCVLYRTGGSGEWTFNDTVTLPYEYIGGGTNYIAYNNPNAGGVGIWGLSSVGGANFCVYYLLGSTTVQGGRQFFLIPDQAFTGTLSAAQARNVAQMSWGTLPFEEGVPLYKIIYRTGAGYGTPGRARIEEISVIYGNGLSVTITGGVGVTDHASLTGRTAADSHPASAITDFIPSRGGTLFNPSGITAGANVIVWYAPYACEVTNVRGYRVGGTSATINARRNGASNHLAAALSLPVTDTWTDGGAVQNITYAAGDKLEIMLVTVAGSPTQIAIQVDFRRI